MREGEKKSKLMVSKYEQKIHSGNKFTVKKAASKLKKKSHSKYQNQLADASTNKNKLLT